MSFLGEAIAKLSATPQQLEEVTGGLSDAQLSWRPGSEKFSLRENVLHLRDIDVEGYERRLQLILSESRPALPNVDGARLARERDYNAQPVEPALADFWRSRAASVEKLKTCSDHDLERAAEMEGAGAIDLRRLLEMWMEHDRGHIADMIELRRCIETGEAPSLTQHQAA